MAFKIEKGKRRAICLSNSTVVALDAATKAINYVLNGENFFLLHAWVRCVKDLPTTGRFAIRTMRVDAEYARYPHVIKFTVIFCLTGTPTFYDKAWEVLDEVPRDVTFLIKGRNPDLKEDFIVNVKDGEFQPGIDTHVEQLERVRTILATINTIN